jgi:hypothetical protein
LTDLKIFRVKDPRLKVAVYVPSVTDFLSKRPKGSIDDYNLFANPRQRNKDEPWNCSETNSVIS